MIRQITATLLKTKDTERTLTASGEKQHITSRGRMTRMSTHVLSLEARQWNNIFKVLKERRRKREKISFNSLSGEIFFKNEGRIKTFTEKEKLKESATIGPGLQEMLNKILQSKEKLNQQGTQMLAMNEEC